MRNYNNEIISSPLSMKSVLQGLRAAGAVVGLITMLIGLIYATNIFMLILGALKNPTAAQSVMTQWMTALGGDQLGFTIQGIGFPGATLLTVVILGALTAILPWLAIALLTTGAKILAWTLGDKEAIKKILTHTFGPGLNPSPKPPEQTALSVPKPDPSS